LEKKEENVDDEDAASIGTEIVQYNSNAKTANVVIMSHALVIPGSVSLALMEVAVEEGKGNDVIVARIPAMSMYAGS
jgi:hypothetical protein